MHRFKVEYLDYAFTNRWKKAGTLSLVNSKAGRTEMEHEMQRLKTPLYVPRGADELVWAEDGNSFTISEFLPDGRGQTVTVRGKRVGKHGGLRTAYQIRRADGSEWTTVLYRPMAEKIAARDSATEGPLTVHEIQEITRHSSKKTPKTTKDFFKLLHDGREIMRGTSFDIAAYIHSHHSYSVDHALKHEGFSMVPAKPRSKAELKRLAKAADKEAESALARSDSFAARKALDVRERLAKEAAGSVHLINDTLKKWGLIGKPERKHFNIHKYQGDIGERYEVVEINAGSTPQVRNTETSLYDAVKRAKQLGATVRNLTIEGKPITQSALRVLVEAKGTTKRRQRLYNLVAINERTGFKEYLTSSPVTHSEANTMRTKFNPHKDVRIQLEGVGEVVKAKTAKGTGGRKFCLSSGYAYRLEHATDKRGADAWRKSSDEPWEIVVVDSMGPLVFLGKRRIDGAECVVLRTGDWPNGNVYAQTVVSVKECR